MEPADTSSAAPETKSGSSLYGTRAPLTRRARPAADDEDFGGGPLLGQLTVDTEDRAFNSISATSFPMVKNAGVTGAQIDVVELFMNTTTGGAAGRFQMTRADAEALDARKLSQEYFIRHVIY
ncbi:MAG TPA: hypothetical protein VNA69_14505 [Thermoanaerobaculia bacterium]|nr:hypothetical protein [Thermoanaerobaculia bacterium]